MTARAMLAFSLFVCACGAKPAGAPLAPLPPDPTPTAVTPEPTPTPADTRPMAPLPPPEVPAPMAFELAAADATVTLVSAGPGKGKGTPLRFAPAVGKLAPVRIAIDANLAVSGQPDATSPTVAIDFALEVTRADKAGFDLLATVAGADMIDAPGAQPVSAGERAELTRIIGSTMTTTVAANGQWGAIKVNVPLGTSITRELFDTVAVGIGTSLVLPEQAIRKGATWTVALPFELAGVAMLETTSYELAELTTSKGRTTIAVKGAVAITGADQTMMESGMSIDVSKIGGTGTAAFGLALADAVPTGASKTTTAMTYTSGADAFSSVLTLGKTVAAATPVPATP